MKRIDLFKALPISSHSRHATEPQQNMEDTNDTATVHA